MRISDTRATSFIVKLLTRVVLARSTPGRASNWTRTCRRRPATRSRTGQTPVRANRAPGAPGSCERTRTRASLTQRPRRARRRDEQVNQGGLELSPTGRPEGRDAAVGHPRSSRRRTPAGGLHACGRLERDFPGCRRDQLLCRESNRFQKRPRPGPEYPRRRRLASGRKPAMSDCGACEARVASNEVGIDDIVS